MSNRITPCSPMAPTDMDRAMDHVPAGDHSPPGSHFIDGSYTEDMAGDLIEIIFPATEEIIGEIRGATGAVIEHAVSTALSGQRIWSELPASERGRVLRRAAEIMRARNQELSELETLDTGKPLQETVVADAASGADALEYFGSLIATERQTHIPLGNDFIYTRREPLGLCVGIGAWNYPMQIACWKAAPALACGNSMIFKPSELTPLSALKLAEIFIEAGLPPGVFNIVQGNGSVGAALVDHPDISKISLTGSVATGKKLYAAAAINMKQVSLELGGKSPLIICDDADLKSAASAAINGNFYASGQICSNGTRVFVHQSVQESFLALLQQRLNDVVIGDPRDSQVNFGPLVSRQQMQRVLHYISLGKSDGATLVCGGERVNRIGYYVAPTIFADVTDDMTIAREEIFGPVMSILSFDDDDEVIKRANATRFGLAAGVFTKDIARAHRITAQLKAGTCWINSYNITPVEMPFGGVKDSGFGRENSIEALHYYSQIKSVYVGNDPTSAPY